MAAEAQTLSPKQWESLFNLMGALILSDGEVQEAEVVAFDYSIRTLCARGGVETIFGRDELARWLDYHAADIRSHLRSERRDIWIADQLHPLEAIVWRGEIYRTLETVVLSDRDLIGVQRDILELAAALFGMQPSRKITQLHPTRA